MGLDAGARRAGRVLVAEDEPHIRRILLTLLEVANLPVVAVEDGALALELIRGEEDFDLILLDIMMPGATGLEILAEARNLPHRAGTPIIILTAKGQDADREQAFSLGAAGFVTKPFSPKKLLVLIDELLNQP